MPTVLVTGANRGLGLELIKQYSQRGWEVIGTCRDRDIPVACVIGGGYSDDIDALASRHAILHRTAAEFA